MERNIALKLMYNGTAYHGWQVQKNAISVAETLEKALAATVGHPVKCTGAGRTDAGVHAEVYVANFRTTCRIPLDKLPLAVNTRLPNDIVVVKATQVPDGFNAIGSRQKKLPGSRPVQAADNIHQCRFSGAGRPHNRYIFSFFDLQRNIL